MSDVDEKAVALAFRLHRNYLKRNQAAAVKCDWRDFYPTARAFLGLD